MLFCTFFGETFIARVLIDLASSTVGTSITIHTSEPPSILTDVVLGQLEHGSERHDILGRRCPSCEIVGHRDSPPGRLGRSFGQNLEDLLGPVPRNNTHGQAL